jgi:hypothetical protein
MYSFILSYRHILFSEHAILTRQPLPAQQESRAHATYATHLQNTCCGSNFALGSTRCRTRFLLLSTRCGTRFVLRNAHSHVPHGVPHPLVDAIQVYLHVVTTHTVTTHTQSPHTHSHLTRSTTRLKEAESKLLPRCSSLTSWFTLTSWFIMSRRMTGTSSHEQESI